MRKRKDITLILDVEEVDVLIMALDVKEREIKSVYATVPIFNIPQEYQDIKEYIPKIRKYLRKKLSDWCTKENEKNA